MAALDFKIFDGDNHYYEAEDAFTRHMDSRMQRRCMEWAEIQGKNAGALSIQESFGDLEPLRLEYRDRDAHLRVMDE
ncbi:MAG: hypothetical protein VCB99_12490 [Myxococcota bacterium]